MQITAVNSHGKRGFDSKINFWAQMGWVGDMTAQNSHPGFDLNSIGKNLYNHEHWPFIAGNDQMLGVCN